MSGAPNAQVPAHVVLVPGFWLGAWAWDEVLTHLAEHGVTALAVTLPGLESVSLHDERRLDVPGTIVCTAFPAAEYRSYAEQGVPFLAGVLQHPRLELVDLPTGHWPMWSRPAELADIIAQAATAEA